MVHDPDHNKIVIAAVVDTFNRTVGKVSIPVDVIGHGNEIVTPKKVFTLFIPGWCWLRPSSEVVTVVTWV